MAASAYLVPSCFCHLFGVVRLRPPLDGTASFLDSSSEASEGGGESWSAGGVRRPASKCSCGRVVADMMIVRNQSDGKEVWFRIV